jgi:hypothetical protein
MSSQELEENCVVCGEESVKRCSVCGKPLCEECLQNPCGNGHYEPDWNETWE